LDATSTQRPLPEQVSEHVATAADDADAAAVGLAWPLPLLLLPLPPLPPLDEPFVAVEVHEGVGVGGQGVGVGLGEHVQVLLIVLVVDCDAVEVLLGETLGEDEGEDEKDGELLRDGVRLGVCERECDQLRDGVMEEVKDVDSEAEGDALALLVIVLGCPAAAGPASSSAAAASATECLQSAISKESKGVDRTCGREGSGEAASARVFRDPDVEASLSAGAAAVALVKAARRRSRWQSAALFLGAVVWVARRPAKLSEARAGPSATPPPANGKLLRRGRLSPLTSCGLAAVAKIFLLCGFPTVGNRTRRLTAHREPRSTDWAIRPRPVRPHHRVCVCPHSPQKPPPVALLTTLNLLGDDDRPD
jgi:hypothetical protein